MDIIVKPFEIEATLDRVTGGISIGQKPKEIEPTEADFAIPTEAPEESENPDIVDHRLKVRRSLFAIMEAEEGLESLRMADFLKSLTNAERQSLYEDVFQHTSPFTWLLCVSPTREDEVIDDMKALLAMTDKHSPAFRTKRAAFEKKLDTAIGNRFQNRNNARYVRANPHAIPTSTLPDGTIHRADEAYYRRQLGNQTAL